MDYNFKKLAEVEALSEVPGNATVLAEVGGAVKRIPGSGLGGGGDTAVVIRATFTEQENDDGEMELGSTGTVDLLNGDAVTTAEAFLTGSPTSLVVLFTYESDGEEVKQYLYPYRVRCYDMYIAVESLVLVGTSKKRIVVNLYYDRDSAASLYSF